ncbi:glycosyltransferase, partial [Candidatus Magnetomorum sp. HK-1]
RNVYNSISARPFSKLFFVGDSSNWVLSWEVKEVMEIARKLKINTSISKNFGFINQSIFYASKYILLNPKYFLYLSSIQSHIAFSYFHGYPDSGEPTALACYQNLKKYHRRISRIQVSHSKMKNFVLDTKIDPKKVFLIPIAINPDFFKQQTPESKIKVRAALGIPQQAVVIGSFQKDGVGMGDGTEPKAIKGPDIFIKTLEILKNKIPEIFVLLSGPARGYVINGLEKLNIPYKHIYLSHYPDICQLFQCIDVYIIASREEGGPKAILESMISGVPLVTTRVGQAMDLVEHEKNAMMTSVEDSEGLAFFTEKILQDTSLKNKLTATGLLTAKSNTYSAHIPLWKRFFDDFVYVEK